MTLHVRQLAQALVFSLLVFVAGASPHAHADWTRPMTCSTSPDEVQVADVEFNLTVTLKNGMGTDAKALPSCAVSEDAVSKGRQCAVRRSDVH
ncbi:MAG: hypothetical protein H7222_07750 [Methylotenera sp.]|nr:hypothetical protein [Oligoflexia bacterium]